MDPIGHRRWAIADGYLPAWSKGPEPEMLSHESINILNTGSADVQVELMIYFEDRAPAGPYRIRVPAERTVHQRINELDPPVPTNLGYSCVITADAPVVVQQTRLDSRQAENAVFSTMASPC